jgi:aspartate carbamoyltransferase catalytic subunit
MAAVFYEPSTRTRLSFEAAMRRLGGQSISTENARQFSSAAKGESLEDTVRVVSSYADIIVLRYDKQGGAERAQRFSRVPVINAGDGSGQHPTQALLDLYTIREAFGQVEGLNIVMVGDLANGRTVHSLCYFIGKLFPINKIVFVSPKRVEMNQEIKEYLGRKRVDWEETTDILSVLSKADVVYQTRVQTERFKDSPMICEQVKREAEKMIITEETLRCMKEKSIIMHPLPRVNEISYAVDSDPRAAYFQQAENGLYIRMALLKMILVGY